MRAVAFLAGRQDLSGPFNLSMPGDATNKEFSDALAEALNLESVPADPFEQAIADAERAIEMIHAGEESVDLRPAGSAIRRYQHQMARLAILVSHSYGKDPNRHVRIFNTGRNG